jgi:deoxyribodipyrimidine photo-lyase
MPTESIPPATVVWFRRDLRLSDNPALGAAVARGGAVVAAWVHAPGEEGDSAPGAAARVFLHGALRSLAESLEARGGRLALRRGPTIKALIDLAKETGADAVYANKVWEPAFLARDAKAVAALRANGLEARLFDDGVLFPPDAMKTAAGGPFRVFTPFWRRCLSSPGPEAPRPAPARIRSPGTPPPSWPLPELRLLPSVPWDAGSSPPGRRASSRGGIAWRGSSTKRWRRIPTTANGRTGTERPGSPPTCTSAASAPARRGTRSSRARG